MVRYIPGSADWIRDRCWSFFDLAEELELRFVGMDKNLFKSPEVVRLLKLTILA